MAQKNILKYIILGLLNREDLAGYDIKKLFEEELGDFWYSNHSQIYPELRRMEDDGLISSRTELVGKKLEKKFYQITKDGQKLLSAWMDESLNPLVPTRDEFTMKLYLLDSADHPLVTRLFQEEIARHEENTNTCRPAGSCCSRMKANSRNISATAAFWSRPSCGKSSVWIGCIEN
jgi:DNA-binding PadR family transcriptional regulator